MARVLVLALLALFATTFVIVTVYQKSAPSGMTVSYTQRNSESFEAPDLPDISRFTVQNIERKVPPQRIGSVKVDEMKNYPDLAEFLEDDAPRALRLVQKRIHPQAIVVRSGNYTLSKLYMALQNTDAPEAMTRKGKIYTLRMPLLVAANASLTVSGNDVSELRLSREQGAFIASSGNLFLIRTKVSGWSEKDNKPAWFKDKNDFRPFITVWSGGKLYAAKSTVRSLGYMKGKAYGFSYSTCVACLKKNLNLPRPTGEIVESRFSDMYYGFYSYEADDVAIVRNVYADNIVYGIDPHDRSNRLIIAENEAYGTRKKHGIIGSREVKYSWIFNNYSHDNHGSGIMLDRTSSHNIVANNVSTRNGADGITFFESENNISYNNMVMNNARTGVRARNSWNIRMHGDQIAGNGGPAIHVYTARLEEKEKHRDFELDPYTQRAGAEIVDVSIRTLDDMPAFKVGDHIDGLKISGLRLLSPPRLFAGKLSDDEELLARVQEDGTFVEVSPRRVEESSEKGKLSRLESETDRTEESRLTMLSNPQVTSK